MPYSRAFSTLGCPELSLEEALALAERTNIRWLELRTLWGTVELPRLLTLIYGSPASLAERIRESAVGILSFDTSWRLAGAKPGDREAVFAFLPWAEALGVRRLRVFDGVAANPRDSINLAAEAVREWQELRRERGWNADLMVETHDSLTDTASLRAFTQAVPGVAILWDTHHTWRRGEDPLDTWQAIRPSVVHIHVKDSVSRPSGRNPFTYVLPGQGEFPQGPLRAALQADDYSGPVSLEWERFWHPELPPLEAALRAAETGDWW